MFTTLVESRRKRSRSGRSVAVSAVLHCLLIAGAVYGTGRAAATEVAEPIERIAIVVPPPDVPEPPPVVESSPAPPAAARQLAAPIMSMADVLIPPIEIPNAIPAIEIGRPVTSDDFRRAPAVGAIGTGSPGLSGPGTGDVGGAYRIADVDQVAEPLPGNKPPEYPGILKRTRTTGAVLVTFVVDTAGAPDMNTLKVVESDHALFAESVRKALAKMRFRPAILGQRPVPMWVSLPFEFIIKD